MDSDNWPKAPAARTWNVWLFPACGHLADPNYNRHPGERCPECNNFGRPPERVRVGLITTGGSLVVTPDVRPLTEVRDELHAELCWFVRRNDLNGTPPRPGPRGRSRREVRLRDYALAISAVQDLAAAIFDLDRVIGKERES